MTGIEGGDLLAGSASDLTSLSTFDQQARLAVPPGSIKADGATFTVEAPLFPTAAQDERLRIFLGGRFDRLAIDAIAQDAAGWPSGLVLELEYSADGNIWRAPGTAVQITGAGLSDGNVCTGRLWASVRVKTPASGRVGIILTASRNT